MRMLVAALSAVLWTAGMANGCAAGGDAETETNGECAVGSETCPCTTGGACDPGLLCLSNICVDPNNETGGGGDGSGGGGIGGAGGMDCVPDGEGCQAVDVIFALDSSGSMQAENGALAATQAFQQVVDTISRINCSQVDFRIGITNDNDSGFVSTVATPWFDSGSMSNLEIANAFSASANMVIGNDSASLGCEHVLTSATDLLINDTTGFVRDGALLVVVLVTDADDYGSYDMPGGNVCGLGCTVSPQSTQALYQSLLTLKGDDAAALATIVVAGDPNGTPNTANLCQQPGSCNCNGQDCDAYFATRLHEFAGLVGSNGVTANLCAGAASVPGAVQAAFDSQIDLACQELEPPK